MNFCEAASSGSYFKRDISKYWLRWTHAGFTIVDADTAAPYRLSLEDVCAEDWGVKDEPTITLTLSQFRAAIRRTVDERMLLEDILFP